MNRWVVFWEQFWSDIKWAGSLPEITKRICPQVLIALAFLGFAVPTATQVDEWLRPWSPYLLYPVIIYFTWKAAIAWHKTAGPVIWLGKTLKPDKSYRMYDLRVVNRGSGHVVASVYAVELQDVEGERIPIIDTEIPLHWRGLPPGQRMTLHHDKHGLAGIFLVDEPVGEHSSGFPKPCLICPAQPGTQPGNFRLVPLDPEDVPLERQSPRCLALRVDFSDEDGKCLKSKIKRFWIVPDATSVMRYRVLPFRGFGRRSPK